MYYRSTKVPLLRNIGERVCDGRYRFPRDKPVVLVYVGNGLLALLNKGTECNQVVLIAEVWPSSVTWSGVFLGRDSVDPPALAKDIDSVPGK
ncbi:hypothetical protein CEP51_014434 [Fusarium floridanum]|uniref:Uncharacterized protein n=1 Tax=Fusarium floridanum TaxID=1325733 RepID=A0A428PTF6_9HYPO|nr:hypothetical protein CEP51_014434 [Fusarium floridanum]